MFETVIWIYQSVNMSSMRISSKRNIFWEMWN